MRPDQSVAPCARAESFCLAVRVTKGPANTVVSRPPGAPPKGVPQQDGQTRKLVVLSIITAA